MADPVAEARVLALAAQIVSAHMANNAVSPQMLPALIQSVYRALTKAGEQAIEQPKPIPAVPVNKSVFPDHLVCLEDGKHFAMLKRHLLKTFQMTPDQYRKRWDLSASYPMVAPNYSKVRSSLAKQSGLGRKPTISAPALANGKEPRRRATAARAARG